MSKVQRIVLVGHCGADGAALRRAAASALPEAEVAMVNDEASLTDHTGPGALLLVNRVLDGRFEAETGVALIERLAGGEAAPRLMLVSNFAEAQREAERAGALPGFGKSELFGGAAHQRLRAAAGAG